MEPRRNEQIRINELRLIDENGDLVGIVSNKEAQDRAAALGLDLIEIASSANPPVCKIMDYGKFKYDQEKKAKEAKKHQHQTKLKEIKFTPRISEHDYSYRCVQAKKFLSQGDRLKASVFFKGRELSHTERGTDILNKLVNDLKDVSIVDKDISLQGKYMSVYLAPARR